MTKSRGILGPRTPWTEEQLDMLRTLYPKYKTENVAFLVGHSLESTYRKASSLGLKKSAEFLASGHAGRLDGIRGGATRFQKGHTSWNKGTKGVHTGGEQTQFKPGQMPYNTAPIGAYRLDPDGTLQRKISDAKGANNKRWRSVHELVWIEANGPVPPKHMVVFRPGMRTNVLEEITIDKVECVSRAEHMKRHTRHNLPPELNEVIQLRAVLTRQINNRMKSHEQEEHR